MENITRLALRIIKEAERKKIVLRLLGATAIRLHCPHQLHLLDSLNRHITDIDYAAYERDKDKLFSFFTDDLKCEILSRVGVTPGLYVGRMIFLEREQNLHIDIFLDKLHMCHTINFQGRLEADYPTSPLAELFLEKLQIVKINEKDIKDLVALLLEHEFGNDDDDKINIQRVAALLCQDWGFFYTVTTNLTKTLRIIEKYEVLDAEKKKTLEGKVKYFINYLTQQPKSLRWKLRSIIGPRVKWYEEVEEVDRTTCI
jgi:hypothetical protein